MIVVLLGWLWKWFGYQLVLALTLTVDERQLIRQAPPT